MANLKFRGKFKIQDHQYPTPTTINEWMIRHHHAAPYFGQSKDEIAQIHLDNRRIARDDQNDYSNG